MGVPKFPKFLGNPVQINAPALGLYDQFDRFGRKYHSFKKDSGPIREIIYISASQNLAGIHSASINEFHRSLEAQSTLIILFLFLFAEPR
jgi:hypothetical protein